MKEQNEFWSSPLADGKSNSKAKTVQILLEHGADVTARDKTNRTPWNLGSSRGSPEIVQLLNKYGADVKAMDGRERSSRFMSREIVREEDY